MQSIPLTVDPPAPRKETSVGDSPPSQSHLQDFPLHASDTPAWRTRKNPRFKDISKPFQNGWAEQLKTNQQLKTGLEMIQTEAEGGETDAHMS